MKPEQQRIAIAEACGWVKTWADKGKGQRIYDTVPHPLPDYLNDLNAMHDAEKTLTSKQRAPFVDQLYGIVSKTTQVGDSEFWVFHANATQRAEAFLRTLNLWHPPVSLTVHKPF